jgi:hypothetical protein
MAFITLPPVLPTHFVCTADNLWVLPQYQECIYYDPNNGNQRLSIYAGELKLACQADSGHIDFTFQYPLLGTFRDLGGSDVVGIMQLNDPRFGQFRSAIANASLAICNAEDIPTWLNISMVAADLYQIELDSRKLIHAVVLSGAITVRNSVLTTVSYRVSVLERLNGNPEAQPPIFIGDEGWTGRYNLVSNAVGPLERSGIPQDKIGPGA